MATFQVTDEWANYLSTTKTIDMDADTFKAALTNTAPTKAGTQVIADITQIAATGGYAVVTLAGVTFAETAGGSGIWKFNCNAFAWTASGAAFANARYAVIYDDTPAGPVDPVVGYIDYGSSVALADGATWTWTPGANGIYLTTVS